MRVQCSYIFLICIFNIVIGRAENIQISTCDQHTQFTCDDQSCISIQEKCNGKQDCKDGSDERNCSNNCKAPFWFKCHNDQCITTDLVCDGEYDCLDLSDERNCSSQLAKKPCAANQFVCHDGLCISNLWKCNGIEECLLGEDEKSCASMYCKDNIKCGSGECINENWKCDGVFDCRDESDEKDCGSKTKPEFCTSDRGLVLCGDKTHCIPHEEVCNGVANCPDKSDEIFCAASQNCVQIPSGKGNGTLCTCPPGYHLNTGGACKDLDECTQYGICDQLCSNAKGHFNCSCAEGYNLQKDGRTCEVSEGDVMLFYSNNISIRRLLIKSQTTFSMVKNLFNVMALAFYDNRIYYSELIENDYRISSADESGSDKKNLITIGLGEPAVIAIDYITTNLYFTDSKFQHIAVCTIDGVHCKVLLISHNDRLHGLALHPARGEMFWSEWGTTPRIAHASMDGENAESFITDNLGSPMGIAVDVSASRLFWVDSQKKLIESVKLDGTDRRVIFKANLIHLFSLAVFENRVYWSDLTTHTIESCDKFNGRNHKTLVKHSGETLSDIEVYHPLMHENHTNPCKNATCSELCLLTYRGGYTCQCSEGKKLDSNTTSCINMTSAQKYLLGTINSLWMMEYKDLGRLKITKLPVVVENITAVAYNIKNDTVFIADGITKSIKKLNLHNYKIDIIITNVDSITALDYDYLGNNIYWCDSEKEIVEVYNLETKARSTITTLPSGQKPISIALVPEFGYIFLSVQKFKGIAEVVFLYMGGSDSVKILRDALVGPVYLTYDPFLKNIFWADSSTGNIESYHIIDKQRKVFRSSQASVRGILVSQNNVLWIKEKSNKLFWSDRSHDLGPQRNNHFTIDDISHNEDITHFISISPRSIPTHPCEYHNGNCSHICVPGENMSAKCLCPFGMNLTSDGKTCDHVLICQKDEFKCNKSEICIPTSSRCNRKHDCIYGEDESDCPTVVTCPEEYFQCHNEDCINEDLVCDMKFDCRDGSDELDCENMIIKSKCSRNEFMCSDSTCIPNTNLCNNVTDCSGGEDELNCNRVKCKKDYYRCPIGGCIPNKWLCDQEQDCIDGSDEHEDCDYKKCKFPDFICATGLCIDEDLVCNNVNDCGDNSDEVQCKKNYTNNCKPNEFSCFQSKSVCLPSAVRCNETVECPNYEDEEGCSECLLGEFMCTNGKCIPSVYVCDRYTDCEDKSDESYTLCSHIMPTEAPPNKPISCDNKFTCKDDGHCIDNHLVCNGAPNCKDGSDEGALCSVSCNQTCTSCMKSPQGPKCLCHEGFRLSGDRITCVDIEECKHEPPVCSQMCEELQGSFNCKCYEDFQLRHDRISCKSVDENLGYTIMSDDTIFTILPNQKLEEVFVANSVLNITDFDISIPNNLIYFIAEEDGELHRINLTTKEHSYMAGLGRPQLLSVEWISENVYYVNENITNRLIHVCNFETGYCSVIHSVVGNNSKITALTVDAVNKYVFYAEVEMGSSPKSKIYKCNLDGSYLEEIHVSNGDYVTGMTFDFHKELLYFADQIGGLVFKISYHGSDQMTILYDFPNSSRLNTYENHLYFFNSKHELEICPLFGNYFACTKNILHDIEIQKFVMNHSSIQPLSNRSICQTSKCSKLCVPIDDAVTCLCESTESNGIPQDCNGYQWSKYTGKLRGENSGSGSSIWKWLFACLLAVVAVACAIYFFYPERTRSVVYQSVRYVSQRGRRDNDAELLIGD